MEMSSGYNPSDLPESLARVHRLATRIAGELREQAATTGLAIGVTPTDFGLAPVSRATIEALPATIVSEDCFKSCAICLEDATAGMTMKEMPCGHDFHPSCLCGWLTIRGSCPVCRRIITESEAIAGEGDRT